MIGSALPTSALAARASGAETLKSLARRSGLHTALTLAFDWGLIAAAVLASAWTRSLWIYGLSVVVISRQMNALFEFHHQAIHGNLFRTLEWNERLDWLYSIPLFTRVPDDRDEHMEHHATFSVETRDDLVWGTGYGLDLSRQTDRSYMIWFLLVRPFVGILQFDAFRGVVLNPSWRRRGFRGAVVIYWASVLSLFALAGRLEWIVWYWLVPYFTLYQVLFFWDDMIGHYNCPQTGTREMRGLWFRLLATHGTAYHNVHHLYPKIPWFNQKRATALFVDEKAVDVAHGFADAIRQAMIVRE